MKVGTMNFSPVNMAKTAIILLLILAAIPPSLEGWSEAQELNQAQCLLNGEPHLNVIGMRVIGELYETNSPGAQNIINNSSGPLQNGYSIAYTGHQYPPLSYHPYRSPDERVTVSGDTKMIVQNINNNDARIDPHSDAGTLTEAWHTKDGYTYVTPDLGPECSLMLRDDSDPLYNEYPIPDYVPPLGQKDLYQETSRFQYLVIQDPVNISDIKDGPTGYVYEMPRVISFNTNDDLLTGERVSDDYIQEDGYAQYPQANWNAPFTIERMDANEATTTPAWPLLRTLHGLGIIFIFILLLTIGWRQLNTPD